MTRLTRIAAAVIIAAGIGGMLYWATGNSSVAFAFEDAVRPMIEADTLMCDLIIQHEGQADQVSRLLVRFPYHIRQESANGDVNVVDLDQHKVLELHARQKIAVLRERTGDGYTPWDGLQQMYGFIAGTAEGVNAIQLEPKTIDGQHVVGFQVPIDSTTRTIGPPNGGTLTVWADPITRLTVRVEVYNEMLGVTSVLDNIVLNSALGDTIFAMDIPDGYTSRVIQRGPPETVTDPQVTEATAIAGLRSWLAVTDGRFPSSLALDAAKDIHPDARISFKLKGWSYSISLMMPSPDDVSDPEEKQRLGDVIAKLRKHIGPIFYGFQAFSSLTNDQHYAGEGVTGDDADTAVFWYRPDDSPTYRVIYADLTLRDVAPEDLPQVDDSEQVSGAP